MRSSESKKSRELFIATYLFRIRISNFTQSAQSALLQELNSSIALLQELKQANGVKPGGRG